MSWTSNVTCTSCGGTDWTVIAGSWTCRCGHVMTPSEIAAWHATSDTARSA